MKKVINYFMGVKTEIERVRWASKKEVAKYSFATVLFIIFFALLFLGIDVTVTFLRGLLD